MPKHPKQLPDWTKGTSAPRGYVDWWDWINSTARSVAEDAISTATEPAWIETETSHGTRVEAEDRLREIDDGELLRDAHATAHSLLDNAFVDPAVDRKAAGVYLYNHAKDWLERRGYSVV